MKVGTKSVLFGAHFFLTHWIFVAMGWYRLYGFKRVRIGFMERGVGPVARYPITASLWDWRLWVVFLIHDLGYWGKPNMDGDEGETHPEWACRKLNGWFGAPWGTFSLYHSRFYAKKAGQPVSALCYADKLAIAFEPSWFYLPRVRLTGEIKEYLKMAAVNSAGVVSAESQLIWHKGVQDYVKKWVEEHKDGKDDTWTTADRKGDKSGVWQ